MLGINELRNCPKRKKNVEGIMIKSGKIAARNSILNSIKSL
jgi:hypothetical protein